MSEIYSSPPAQPVLGRLPDGTHIRLRLHPSLTEVPGWEGDEEFAQLCGSIRQQGIINPLLVHTAGEMDAETGAEWADVFDGRHRFAAYSLVEGWERGPAPCVETDQPVKEIIIRTLVERRHASKGTRAYLVWPLICPVKKGVGRPSKKLPTESVITEESLPDLAARYGFSVDLFDQARQLHEIFASRKDLREEFEPGILSGGTGLGAALAGIAGKTSTEGKPRRDAAHVTLLERGFRDLRNRFEPARWEAMPAEDRAKAESAAVECVLTWPEEVRARLRKAL